MPLSLQPRFANLASPPRKGQLERALDHFVVGLGGVTSFAERGLL